MCDTKKGWEKNGKRIAKERNFTNQQIAEYASAIKFAGQWMKLNKVDKPQIKALGMEEVKL